MTVNVNNLTDFDLDESEVIGVCEWLLEREPSDVETVSVGFVDDERMKEMNEEFYNEEGTTDVLTFDYGDGSIEITLNPYQHRRQAPDVGNTLNEEVTENLIHGYLHTCGYNHLEDDGEHLRRQEDLLETLFSTEEPSLVEAVEETSS